MQPGADFKRGVVSAFGYEVPFAEAGTGDAIISLPASAGLEMSKAKDMLARDYRVIELDPPGWGETPSVAAAMKQRHLAAILAAAVEEIGIERYIVMGTSLGGVNALWLARQFPDRVSAMVLEAPMAFYRQEDLINPEAEKMIQAIRSGALSRYDADIPPPPVHPQKPWATTDFFHEQMRRRFKMFRFTDTSENAALEPFARSMSIPTTLVLGTEDEFLKPNYAARLSSIIPNLKVKIVEGATHDIQNTGADAFVQAVRAAHN